MCSVSFNHQIGLRASFSHVPICRGGNFSGGQDAFSGRRRSRWRSSGSLRTQPGLVAMALCFGSGVISCSPCSCTRAGLCWPLVCVAESSIPGPSQGEEFSLELCLMRSFSTCADAMKIVQPAVTTQETAEGEMSFMAAAAATGGQRINTRCLRPS